MAQLTVASSSRTPLNVRAVAQPHSRGLEAKPDCSIYRSILGQIEKPTYWQRDALRAPARSDTHVPVYASARLLAKSLSAYLAAEAKLAQVVQNASVINDEVSHAHKHTQKALADLAWLMGHYPERATHPPRSLLQNALALAIPLRREELKAGITIPLPPALESRSNAAETFAVKLARQHKGRLSPYALSWLTGMKARWNDYREAEANLANPLHRHTDEAFAQLCFTLRRAQAQADRFRALAFAGVADGSTWSPAVKHVELLLSLRDKTLQNDKRYALVPQSAPEAHEAPTRETEDETWAKAFAQVRTYTGRPQPKTTTW